MVIRCFTRGLIVAAIAALAMPALAAGRGAGAERAFDAFLGCTSDFFTVLQAEGSAFGVSEIVAPAPDLAGEGMTETAQVTFAAPVDANGIHLLRYSQMKASGQPDAWWWGFVTDRKPRDLVEGIRLGEPSAEFFEQGGSFYRVLEEGNAQGDTASARTMMINSTGKPDQSLVLCVVTADMMGGMKALPNAADLFRQ